MFFFKNAIRFLLASLLTSSIYKSCTYLQKEFVLIFRWSATYFRCLALNLPPPVKPRLEYPIPRDHVGVTPGWLKALLLQLPTAETIGFKDLWDRWTGACLQHDTLIQLLCLSGFKDPHAIPWLRFIAICAAHLTDVSDRYLIGA